jgi:hypothetical protein
MIFWNKSEVLEFDFHIRSKVVKTNTLSTKIIFFTLLAIAIATGVYIANVTLYRDELLVKGTLSFTTLYLMYRQFISSNEVSTDPDGMHIKFPRDLKFILLGFVVSIITYWAAGQLLSILKHLVKILL